MSSFQDQLESEMYRRGLKKKPVEKTGSEKKKKKPKKEKIRREKQQSKKKPLPFSFSSFFIALIIGSILLFILFLWLWLSADKTAEKLQSRLPTKTAIINKEVDIGITAEDVQPILRMGSTVDESEMIAAEQKAPASSEENTTLTIAPIPGLYESTDYGPLPIINKEDGMTAFKAYKKPANKNLEKPSIAFIMTDMGLNDKQTENLISNLPDIVSFSFSPYAWNVKALMMMARQEGHETWLTLPLETKNYPLEDPGPLSILISSEVKQNQLRLNTLLGKASGYVGFITNKDHVFRAEDVRNKQSFKEIFGRGLAIIDSNDKSINFVEDLAKTKGYPYAQNDFWLDEDLTPLALNQKLRQALEQSRNSGTAIVMLRPYPASIKTLQKFMTSVAAQEFNIVPASTLVKTDEQ